MKVIHTYASYNIIWKQRLYVQMLSALSAKKYFGNIHLYTTPEESKQISEVGIPYDSIDTSLFTKSDQDCYSIPKLKTYAAQTEPFFHVDCDSVFYDKFDLDLYSKIKSPVIFSHADMKSHAALKGKLGDHIPHLLNNKIKPVSNSIRSGDYWWVNNVYLKLYQDLFDVQDSSVKKYFDFNSIPNMSLVLVKDPKLFADAVNKSLSHYHKNKKIIDENDYGPCYIEQLMIHQYMLTISEDYRKRVKKKDIFFFKEVPLSITLKVQAKTNPNISETGFPFKFRVNKWCKCCNHGKGLKKHKIESVENISDYFGFKFNGYTHFSFQQWYQIWQTLIIYEIVSEYGEQFAINIHKYFYDLYPKLDLPVYSEGELMYEKLTGNKIFTEKVVSNKNSSYI